MKLTWSKRMSVGNETLDSEHKHILKLINEIDRAIGAKDSARFAQTLKQLEDSARMHFSNEARIAQAIDYAFVQHHSEHQHILDRIQDIETELAAHHGKWSASVAEHYFQLLSGWAIDHIDDHDMQMKLLLETLPYDFKPDNLLS